MYGQYGGGHHKAWVLDQVTRILHGTEVIVTLARWSNGYEEHRFNLADEPSEAYDHWVKEYMDGEDGPETYGYDIGIAP
jgi:hypothetical protein